MFVIVLNGQLCVTFHLFMLFRFCCVPRKTFIFVFHCEMDKFVLLFTFRFCCVLKEKVSSLYDIVKWANFCYFSPFVLVVLPGRKFFLCSTQCDMGTFVYFSPFVFVVFQRRKLYLCSTLLIWVHLCYFSPFVFVVWRRKKFYLSMTLWNRQIFVTFHLLFLMCFEGESFFLFDIV